MNKLTLHTLTFIAFLLSKLGFAYIAYLAVTNRVIYAGLGLSFWRWFTR